jgi:phage shock protein A
MPIDVRSVPPWAAVSAARSALTTRKNVDAGDAELGYVHRRWLKESLTAGTAMSDETNETTSGQLAEMISRLAKMERDISQMRRDMSELRQEVSWLRAQAMFRGLPLHTSLQRKLNAI